MIGFWRERGVDGFRVDAVQQLMKDAELRDDPPASGAFPLPLHPELAALEGVHSRTDPEIWLALEALRDAAGDALLVGEVYVPCDALAPYLEHLDLAFAFEFLHAPWDAERAGRGDRARAPGSSGSPGRSPTTTSRGSRPGSASARCAPRRCSCSPSRGRPSSTRATRSGCPTAPAADRRSTAPAATSTATRCSGSPAPSGGFTAGEPWLPLTDPERRSVAAQRDDPDSLLSPLPAADRAAARAARAARAAATRPRRARLRARRAPGRDQPRPRAGAAAGRRAGARDRARDRRPSGSSRAPASWFAAAKFEGMTAGAIRRTSGRSGRREREESVGREAAPARRSARLSQS